MVKLAMGLWASLFIWTQFAYGQSVSLVDCEKVRCVSANDALVARSSSKVASAKVAAATSSSSTTVANNANTRKILNKNTLTLQDAQTYFATTPWNFVLSTGIYRSLDELSDYYSSATVSGSYRINKGLFADFRLGYDTIFYSPHDKTFLFNSESANPRMYGLTDLRIGISLPSYITLEEMKSIVSFGSRLTLPTSTRSLDKSLVATLTTYAQMRTRLTPKLMSSVSTSLLLSHFRYDDADVFGYEVNSPLGVSTSLSLSYNLWKRVSTYMYYELYGRYDYDSNFDMIQTMSAGVLVPVTSKLQINFDYMWRDRVITNERLFDNTRSYYSLGLSYSI